MFLILGTHKEFEFGIAAFDAPAGKNLCEALSAEDARAEGFGIVAIKAAREQDFQEEAVPKAPLRQMSRPEKSMTRESSSVPAHRGPVERKRRQIKKAAAEATAAHTRLLKPIQIPNPE